VIDRASGSNGSAAERGGAAKNRKAPRKIRATEEGNFMIDIVCVDEKPATYLGCR
jgi:hypothetical protein